MRELDRIPTPLHSCAIVGAGRLGTALAGALRATGLEIDGPLGRGAAPAGAGAVLLCVPDAEIAAAAAAVPPGAPVGHCSGATGLDVLAGHEAFGLHPLMTVPATGAPAFAGAGAAIAGTTPRALAVAQELARAARAARHDRRRRGPRRLPRRRLDRRRTSSSRSRARRSGSPPRRASTARCSRRSSARRWRTGRALGAHDALTGPIARGDGATVARQRAAVAERAPDLLALYDALADATRALAVAPAAAGGRHEDAPHHRRGPRVRRGRPPRGPQRRARPDDGRVPRRARGADRGRQRRLRRGRRVAVRQPGAVRRGGRPRRVSRAPRPRTPRSPRSSASTSCSRPRSPRSTPPASRPRSGSGTWAPCWRAPSAGRRTSTASAPS